MRGTSLIALLAGVLALVAGLGSILAVLSLLAGWPIGPKFLFELMTFVVPFRGSAPDVPDLRNVTETLKVMKLVPSMQMVGLLVIGTIISGLGIALAQRQGHVRSARVAQAG